MTEHEINFIVTKDLVAAATRRFWLQFVGWGGLLRWMLMSAGLTVLIVFSRQTWAYGVIALLVVLIPMIWVGGYFVFLRRAIHRYGRMESKLISYRFTEQGLLAKSDMGSAEIPWRMLDKVQCHPDVWLLFFGRRDYAYLPTAEIPEPLKEYILQQAQATSAKAT